MVLYQGMADRQRILSNSQRMLAARAAAVLLITGSGGVLWLKPFFLFCGCASGARAVLNGFTLKRAVNKVLKLFFAASAGLTVICNLQVYNTVPMHEFIDWALCGLNFLFFLSGAIFCFSPSPWRFRRVLLGIVFFVLAWHAMFLLVKNTGLLFKYACLFRFAAPFYFLVPPLLYIYNRSFYHHEKWFRKTDWIHFVGFALVLADVGLAGIFVSFCGKEELMWGTMDGRAFVPVVTGLAPRAFYHLLLMVQWPVYIFSQSRRVWQELGGWQMLSLRSVDKPAVVALFSVVLFVNVVAEWFLPQRLTAFFVFFFLLFSVFLFLRPALLYGITAAYLMDGRSADSWRNGVMVAESLPGARDLPEPRLPEMRRAEMGRLPEVGQLPEVASVPEGASAPVVQQQQDDAGHEPAHCAQLIERLEVCMCETEIYRRKGVRIGDVARELGVNSYLLSQAINSYFGQRFTDYINEKRIAYIQQCIVDGAGWKKFSIEGLAAESGFSSRTPFYAAFRKVTGLTPSEYIDRVTAEKNAIV